MAFRANLAKHSEVDAALFLAVASRLDTTPRTWKAFRMSSARPVRALGALLRKLGLRQPVVARDWRRHPRYQVSIDGELDGSPCHIVDLSRGGARVVIRVATAPEVGDRVTLSFSFDGRPFRLQGHARRAAGDVLQRSVGIEFSQGQEDVVGELEALLGNAVE